MTGQSSCYLDEIRSEFERLDLLLHRQILRLRKTYELSLDEFRGLYISDKHVDQLLVNETGHSADVADPTPRQLLERAQELRRLRRTSVDGSPWQELVRALRLTPFEEDVLLLAVAPQIDLKYEILYGYLNNDVSRKWPTRDLALRLFADASEDYATGRWQLGERAPLFANGVLQLSVPDPPVAWLAAGFQPAPGLADFLLGQGYSDSRLGDAVTFKSVTRGKMDPAAALSEVMERELARAAAAWSSDGDDEFRPVLVFEGIDGSGRDEACHRFAQAMGAGAPILQVDLRVIETREMSASWVARLFLYQRLTRAALVFKACEALFDKALRPLPAATQLVEHTVLSEHPVVFNSSDPLPWPALLAGSARAHLRFDVPALAERKRLWRHYAAGLGVGEVDVAELAERYLLTGAQIRDAVAQARQVSRECYGNAPSGLDTLVAAVRTQSNLQLAKLATRVTTPHGWGELVLADKPMSQLREVAQAIRNRHIVYHDWGFAHRVVAGQGIKVLLAGASGTGKTMAAGVIANDLCLDLYAIDLSSVVSKYIGETERNLDRVFKAAEHSNAILFFDEADALYGKRSEIKDAHDRYANIEVSYLLQKVEAHEGAVILATNLKGNIDEAFSRRMHYIIDFPKPSAEQRLSLWTGMFPRRAPLGNDVDFPFLAEQFEMSGGEIKNAALDAAFLAAQDGTTIGMDLVIKAVSRQMVRKGSVPSRTQFKQFYALAG